MSLDGDLPLQATRNGIVLVAILGIICVALSGVGAAAPAAPTEHTLTQPDGTTFTATQWGTEDNHGWETTDGYTIVQNSTGWWRYATVDSGELVPTDHSVGIDEPPSSIEPGVRGAAQTSSRYGQPQQGSHAVSTPSGAVNVEAAPTTGTVKYPVILITYPDKNTTASSEEFQQLIYGERPAGKVGSIQDYFTEASNGQLTVDGNVSAWVSADREHDYYSDDNRAAELVQEAVKKADDQIDYSQYDNNEDGVVDGVIVIHQGGAEEATGNPDDIWSHRWSLSGAEYYGASVEPYRSPDGVTVNSYSINPETYQGEITTLGVLAHETGHLLGMTDLYDTDGGSQGIGEWGLMGSGSWNAESYAARQGSSPAHPVAFHKWQQGWISPTQRPLTGSMGTLEPYAQTSDTAQWLDNPGGVEIGGQGEYFLGTYRTQTGFDQGLPGEGVLITHINEQMTDNTDENLKLVDVEAADGARDMDQGRNRGDPGDVFPNSRATGFGTETVPNSTLYDHTASGLRITEFKIQENSVALNPAPELSIDPTDRLQFTVSSENKTEHKQMSKNVTLSNPGSDTIEFTNFSVEGPDAANFTIDNTTLPQTLEAGQTTAVEVRFVSATNGTYSATLTIGHNAKNSPQTLSLQGTRGTDGVEIIEGVPAVDMNGDNLLDDLNGNRGIDRGDAQALFNKLDSDRVARNVDLLDYNGNGAVDRGDVQALFTHR